jgi:hypothetical protein
MRPNALVAIAAVDHGDGRSIIISMNGRSIFPRGTSNLEVWAQSGAASGRRVGCSARAPSQPVVEP